jgi:hypothetical protein
MIGFKVKSIHFLIIEGLECSKIMIWFCSDMNQIVLMIPLESNLNDWKKHVRILFLIISLNKVRTPVK